jgi:thiamine-phosphate pyrophosphorylase
MKPLPRLYAIADSSFGDPVSLAQDLIAGGARLIQVRDKKAGAGELLQKVERILSFAPDDAEIVVNDRVDVALIAGRAGVHLGQTDLSPDLARRLLGSERLIGFSTHNLEQAIAAEQLPVDYVAVGPIFATTTKENPAPVVGLGRLTEICRIVRKPVVAIGGITPENAIEVLKAGAASVAMIRSLLGSPNRSVQVQDCIDLLNSVA